MRLTTSTSRSTKCLRWESKTQNSWSHCHAQVRHNFIATWEDPDAGHPTSWTWSWFAFKSLPLVQYYETLNVKYWEKSDQIHPENKKPEIKHCKQCRCPQITNLNACLTESKYSPRISSCKHVYYMRWNIYATKEHIYRKSMHSLYSSFKSWEWL